MDILHEIFNGKWQTERLSFPNGGSDDYLLRLQNIESYLFQHVHENVVLLSALNDSGVLTDHGPNHIKTVLRRAGELSSSIDARLSGYEIYILILAVHFHDIGNIYGREQHERRIGNAFQLLGQHIGADNVEKRLIRDIACTHGGYNTNDGTKDTINTLQTRTQIYNAQVRPQLLASILRFADELAEERQRANSVYLNLINDQRSPSLPPGGEAFHKIATLICPPEIDANGEIIKIVYELKEADIRRTFQKLDKQVYLVDEILCRIIKTRDEKDYFSQFTRRYRCKTIEQMSAEIHIFGEDNSFVPAEIYSYNFRDVGYPSSNEDVSAFLARHESKERTLSGEFLLHQLAK